MGTKVEIKIKNYNDFDGVTVSNEAPSYEYKEMVTIECASAGKEHLKASDVRQLIAALEFALSAIEPDW